MRHNMSEMKISTSASCVSNIARNDIKLRYIGFGPQALGSLRMSAIMVDYSNARNDNEVLTTQQLLRVFSYLKWQETTLVVNAPSVFHNDVELTVAGFHWPALCYGTDSNGLLPTLSMLLNWVEQHINIPCNVAKKASHWRTLRCDDSRKYETKMKKEIRKSIYCSYTLGLQENANRDKEGATPGPKDSPTSSQN